MAKEKKQSIDDSKAQIDSLIKEIEGKFGKGLVRPGTDILERKQEIISVSPAIDRILGSGIPGGSFCLWSGIFKSGKTLTALSFAANAQKAGRKVMFLSVEHRLDKLTLSGIKGLDLEEPNFYFIESQKGNILSSKKFLDIGLIFLKNCPGGVLIIDSLSALVSETLIADGLGAVDMSANKIVSQWCDLVAPIYKINDNIIIAICQLATNMGYGKSHTVKAALHAKYASDIMLEIDKFEFEGEKDNPYGQKVNWTCKKAALTSPGKKCESFIKFGIGVDKLKELLIQANDFGLAEIKGGGWTTFSFLTNELKKNTEYEEEKEVKIQGVENACNLLESNPKWLEALEKSVNEIINPLAGT